MLARHFCGLTEWSGDRQRTVSPDPGLLLFAQSRSDALLPPGQLRGLLGLRSCQSRALRTGSSSHCGPPRTEEAILDPSIASRYPTRETTQGDDLVAVVKEPVDLDATVEGLPLRPPNSGNFGDTTLVPGSTAVEALTYSIPGSAAAMRVSRSRRFQVSSARRTISTFSCDIAYSRSPAASRASVPLYPVGRCPRRGKHPWQRRSGPAWH